MPTLLKLLNPFSSSSSSSHTKTASNSKIPFTDKSNEFQPAHPNSTTPLTIIELFQSQGCNSCPPANDYLLSLLFPSSTHSPSHSHNHPVSPSNNSNTLLLTYEVTYWDHLGWPSTLGNKRWDARQRSYATVLDPVKQRVYTPQVLINGGGRPLGAGGWRGVPAALAQPSSRSAKAVVTLERDGTSVCVSGGNGVRGEVVVVFYEEAPADVRILRGENRGEVLRYRNVVRDLVVLGEWDGDEREFELPERREGLEMVVLVQAGRGGEILGAVRV